MLPALIGLLLFGSTALAGASAWSAYEQAQDEQEYADWMAEQEQEQADYEAEQAELAAEAAEENAKLLEQDAARELRSGKELAAEIRYQGDKVLGTTRAFVGKGGVEFSGSTEQSYEETAGRIEKDINQTIRNAKEERDRLLKEAELVRKQKKAYELQADYYNEYGQSAYDYWSSYSTSISPSVDAWLTGGTTFLGGLTSSLSFLS